MGRYKQIAIDQENHICCFPECDKCFGEYGHNASPMIPNGRCCEYCNFNLVIPHRLSLICGEDKKSQLTRILADNKIKVETMNYVIEKQKKEIFRLNKELHKTKEERDKDLVYMNKLLEKVSKELDNPAHYFS